ncbi:MAG: ATP-binding protein [Rhodanobacteraceae bacterium]|jgi:signal transduction histidine kinase|nr:ATP-binding protein [Rhodanobacteraceae bacterium]
MTPAALLLGASLLLAAAAAWRAAHCARLLRAERARAAARLAEQAALAAAQAVAAERERIYSDLHDDLGARLLGMIHAAESPRQADLARALLQDLRDVVTRSRGTPGTLEDVLADIRAEAQQRLGAAGIALAWEQHGDLPATPLEPARALHLYRIVREAVSNVIRHAQARHVRVRAGLAGQHLCLDLTDDGSGAGVAPAAPGGGRRSMRERAAELAGDIHWAPGTLGGTKVLLSVPLEGAA